MCYNNKRLNTRSCVFVYYLRMRCCFVQNGKELDKIKSDLKDNIGSKIRFASKKGRKKRTIRNGVIESTYANVFVIKVEGAEEDNAERRISYTYADILTRNVELALCK